MPQQGNIVIRNARVNNLRGINVQIPRNSLTVVTGISGSGKSSLAFDTLYAEGQRRFAESLSSYARQFLGKMSKPDVDSIEGIPPAIAIEQKVNVRNPRSTVATTSEVYDLMRLLFARIGRTYSPVSGELVHADSVKDVVKAILETSGAYYILAPVSWDQREDKVELMLDLKQEGFSRMFDAKEARIIAIEELLPLDGNYPSGLYLLVDRVKTGDASKDDEDLKARLYASVQSAFDKGGGDVYIWEGDRPLRHF